METKQRNRSGGWQASIMAALGTQERFYILGCQRTGTTLMRLVLDSHPEVFCYDELKGYDVLSRAVVEDAGSARLIGFKIPRWTEQLDQLVLADAGLDRVCQNFYRGEPLVFLCREVRDTIASMLKLRAGEKSWCEYWVPLIIEARVARDHAFRTRYSAELRIAETCSRRLVALAALYWKYKTEAIFEYKDRGFPVCTVSYEELVQYPRQALEPVCSHLGILFHSSLLAHNEFEHGEVLESGLTLGDTDPTKPIRADSVGQWRRFLEEEDLQVIGRVCGELPDRISRLGRVSIPPRAGYADLARG